MVAAWYQDLERMREEYKDCLGVILTIDGLQPSIGHDTLYVVRFFTKQRVWFAEPLISSSYAEIRKVIQRAKALSQQLNKSILGWVINKMHL
jgi:hypothetical protein